jgi:uncharacterized membrane protein YfcA
MSSLALLILGAVVGGFGTLIGAGGGFLLVPLLLSLYPADSPATLTSISLSVVTLNALSGTLAYARAKRVNYRIGLALSIASVPGAIVGVVLNRAFHRGTFDLLFGVILLLLALLLLWKSSAGEREFPAAAGIGGGVGRLARSWLVLGALMSAGVGLVSGLLGIGGGPLEVAMLSRVLGLPVHVATATSQFMVLLASAGGVTVHLVSDHFAPEVSRLAALGVGALVGAQAGAAVSRQVSGGGLVRLLALALSSVGLRLILTAL